MDNTQPDALVPPIEINQGGMFSATELLVARPARVRGGIRPIPFTEDMGVPLRVSRWNNNMFRLLIDPLQNQRRDDEYHIYLNKLFVAIGYAKADDDIIEADVPNLLRSGANTLTYIAVRGSQNLIESEELTLRYHYPQPGYQDRSPGDDQHSELVLELPQSVLDKGIDLETAKKGVLFCFTYPFCRAYDTIRTNLNGFDYDYEVKQTEAPATPSATPTTICILLYDDTFMLAGDHPEFICSFMVIDALTNPSDLVSPWSSPVVIDVDQAGARFPGPIFREVLDDTPDDPGTIDLAKLGSELSGFILTNDNRFKIGDDILVTVTLQIPGMTDLVLNVPAKVEGDMFGQKKPVVFSIPSSGIVIGVVVKGFYTVSRGGVKAGDSKVTKSTVIGDAPQVLQKPRLQKSENEVFDPAEPANQQGGNARIEVPNSRHGDEVQLVMENASGEISPAFPRKKPNANGRANYPVESRIIAKNLGKKIKLWHRYFRDGNLLAESPSRQVRIGTIPDDQIGQPTPLIDNNGGGELDVRPLTANAKLHVSKWLHQVAQQLVSVKYTGLDGNGNEVVLETAKGVSNDSANGYSDTAPVEWLMRLRHESKLNITVRINYGGTASEADSVSLPSRTYIVLTRMFEGFDGRPESKIYSAGEIISTPVLQFQMTTVVPWPANPISSTHIGISHWNYINRGYFMYWYVHNGAEARIEFNQPGQNLSFKCVANIDSPGNVIQVDVYGLAGHLGLRTMHFYGGSEAFSFAGANIIRLELKAFKNAGIAFDDFLLTP
ncbi:hypothetical protein ACOI9X_22375 [Pseudomonas sp. P2757]|uniref:hypothetical protein n=1 Tax=unclassified Pseudomonas TaxID=196821 RepID=UPI003B5C72C7